MAQDPPRDLIAYQRRLEDRVRRLELRGSTEWEAPGAWQLLNPYLNAKWNNPVSGSNTDLTNPFCPRFYVDRDRVYLGGVVKLDTSISSAAPSDTIFAGFPQAIQPARQQDLFLHEDTYWTAIGWAGACAFVWSASPPSDSGALVLVPVSPPNGIAVSLDEISWRISA